MYLHWVGKVLKVCGIVGDELFNELSFVLTKTGCPRRLVCPIILNHSGTLKSWGTT